MSSETAVLNPEPVAVPTPRRRDTLDLIIYWRAIAKRKWWILTFALVIAMGTLLIVNNETPIYRSTVTLLIEQSRAKVAPTEEVYAAVGDSREHFQTQAEIIKARALAAKVVEKYGLAEHPDFDPRLRERPLKERLQKQLGFDVPDPVWTEEGLRQHAIGSLMGRMSVQPVRLSQLVRVSFESPDPVAAADIANAIAATYIQNDIESRHSLTKRASEWLGSRLSGLRSTLEDSERQLQQYRERARIIETKGLAQSGATLQIDDLTGRLIAARQRRFAAEHSHQQITGAKGQLDILPVVMRNPLVVGLKDAEREAERRLAELGSRYGPEHPRIINAEAELKQARENTRRQVDTAVASLLNEYELASANEKAIEKSIVEARSNVQGINRKEFELASLERAMATNRQLYDLFLNRFRETTASRDMQTNAVARITDPARATQTPVKPKKEQAVSIAFVISLLIGALVALLLERLDSTLKSADDVEEKLGHPMLTTLPLLPASDRKSVGRHYLEAPQSVFSEGIRTARTGVLLSASDVERVTLLITSSVPAEGKTAVAINLALAQAQTKRVLLIDADLRRPSIAQQLGLDEKRPGLTNLLSGTPFAECLQRIEGSNLYAISSGPVPLNPQEMIMSQRFQQLMKALAGTCDMLIVDSPPVHLVSDALLLSRMASGVLFVVKADSTPYPLVRRCLRAMEDVDARIFGITLNQLDFKRAERYYGAYTGGYYNKYGAYYGGYQGNPSDKLAPAAALPALRA